MSSCNSRGDKHCLLYVLYVLFLSFFIVLRLVMNKGIYILEKMSVRFISKHV